MEDTASAGSAVEERLTMLTKDLHKMPEAPLEPLGTLVTEEPGEATSALPGNYDSSSGDYIIGAGDSLLFRSFNDESLSTSVRVRYDGHISLPIVPDILVGNLTREVATERVREAFEEEFINPRISLSIVNVESKSYYVMGSVTRPDEYIYDRPITLLDAINRAGGPRINTRGGDSFVGSQGQLVKAIIMRNGEEGREVEEYDMRNLSEPGAHDSMAPVRPGDIVYIPEGINLVYVLGEVRQPSVREITEGMTLLFLMAQVGGPSWTSGRVSHVVLMREINETESVVEHVNLRKILKGQAPDPILQAGDVVYIPQRRLTRLQQFVGRFTGTISPLFSLYNQAWATWYTDDQFRGRGGSGGSDDNPINDLLTLLNTLNAVNPTP
jgi:polysaccharide export outer membrane protein